VAAWLGGRGGERERAVVGRPGLGDDLEALEAGDDAERAIEHAPLGHGVDMGPGQDGRLVTGQSRRTEAAKRVARWIDPRRQTRSAHLRKKPRPRLFVLRTPGGPRDTAPRTSAKPRAGAKTALHARH